MSYSILDNHVAYNKFMVTNGYRISDDYSVSKYLTTKTFARKLNNNIPESLKEEIAKDINKNHSGKMIVKSYDIPKMIDNLNTLKDHHIKKFKELHQNKGIFEAFRFLYRLSY